MKSAEQRIGLGGKSTQVIETRLFEISHYEKSQKHLSLELTVDPQTQKVIAKALLVEKKDRWSDFGKLKNDIGITNFKSYRPCHTWSEAEAILIDQELGITVAISGYKNSVGYVAWSTPEFARLRVELLYKKCLGFNRRNKPHTTDKNVTMLSFSSHLNTPSR